MGSVASLITSPLGIISGLLGGHARRAAQAKNENAAMNYAVQDFDAGLKAVNAAFNAGEISSDTAIQYLEQIENAFWSDIQKYQIAAVPCAACVAGNGSVADFSSHGGTTCNKQCTAGCCVGCNDVRCGVDNCIAAVQAGGGTAAIPEVFASKYGGVSRAGYVLTWSPSKYSVDTFGGISDAVNVVTGVSTKLNSIISGSGSPAGSLSGGGVLGSVSQSTGLSPLLILAGLAVGAIALFKLAK